MLPSPAHENPRVPGEANLRPLRACPCPAVSWRFSSEEAATAAEQTADQTGQRLVVVKAQIHAGGRGKGGGVKVAKGGPGEVRELAQTILGMSLVTHQTGPEGQKVRRVYIEQGLDIARELYLGAVVDRDRRRIAFMASTAGGVEIETVAAETPEKIVSVHVDPAVGLSPYQSRELAFSLGLGQSKDALGKFVKLMSALYEVVTREDCSLCEINPLVVTRGGDLVALDGKIDLDDNALFRHPEWRELEDTDEEDPVELEAKAAGLNYVSLDGNVGCLVNGAGLAMATMDIIKHFGARRRRGPANFLDVGGGANPGAGHQGVQDHLEEPEGEGHLRQHLRRHHEVRRHRRRRHRGREGAGAQGAARRSPRGDQRRARPQDPWRERSCHPAAATHGGWRAEGRRGRAAASGEKVPS